MTQRGGIAYLDGDRLALAMRAGVARLLSRQNHLNRINVFPVADGDTGTNLAFTLDAMIDGLRRRPDRHVGRALATLADAGLDGARGNSGAIMAQFFQGLAEAGGRAARLDVSEFAGIVSEGAGHARQALSDPREGTLLTVLTEFARAVRRQAARTRHDFGELLTTSLTHCEQALARTPEQLAVLRRAGVVDAGAEGFVELLRGMNHALRTGGFQALADQAVAPSAPVASAEPATSRFRYCTECVIEGRNMDAERLREALAEHGDSLVVAGARHKLKVHIHTDSPDAVFRLAATIGRPRDEKADDMWQQQADTRADTARVAIVTDSAADIPESVIEALGIHVIPVHVHFGEQQFLDKLSLSWDEFYRRLETDAHHPTTSQPAPGAFRRLFQMLASHYESIIAIHVTARGSGTWQAASSAARRLPGADIRVIDSRTVSAGLGLLVAAAAEQARAGADADTIEAKVDRLRGVTRVWGAVADMAFAVRGGRVARWKQQLVDALHLTPVLTARPGGRVDAGGVLWGRQRRVERFARFVARRLRRGRRYRLLIGHCNAPEEGRRLLALLEGRPEWIEPPVLVPVGPALGAHAGPGTLVAAIQERGDDPSP